MIIGENWLRIEKLYDGMYRVVTKSGNELAAKLTRGDATAMCCAMCIPLLSPFVPQEGHVWLSFEDNMYRVMPHDYVPEQHELSIGPISRVMEYQDIVISRTTPES